MGKFLVLLGFSTISCAYHVKAARLEPSAAMKTLPRLAEKNLTWSSVERWLDLPLCHRLRYVTLLRWPVARTGDARGWERYGEGS